MCAEHRSVAVPHAGDSPDSRDGEAEVGEYSVSPRAAEVEDAEAGQSGTAGGSDDGETGSDGNTGRRISGVEEADEYARGIGSVSAALASIRCMCVCVYM